MNERILCVDDDPRVLEAYQRALRKHFQIEIALGGDEALEKIARGPAYAVIVADMRMPQMNGVELLVEVKRIAPATVRMMLTGNADQQTALDAVNEGHIFRFMTKPCPPDVFAKALAAGVEQHRLIVAEKELLSKTLRGAVKLATDLLGVLKPEAFGRATQVRDLAGRICDHLRVGNKWMVEIAAMLSQVGCVAVPDRILRKVYRGDALAPAEQDIFNAHPKMARDLLANIPRLEEVAEIIYYQEKHFDGSGLPADYVRGTSIPLGSRILKAALDWQALADRGIRKEMALSEMFDREGWYDPNILNALGAVQDVDTKLIIKQIRFEELADGMVLAGDVMSRRGTRLCSKGQEVTPALRLRLRNYVVNVGLASPIRVFVPVPGSQGGFELPALAPSAARD